MRLRDRDDDRRFSDWYDSQSMVYRVMEHWGNSKLG